MLNILLSPKALNDLEKIFDYTTLTWNYSQANKYQDSIYSGMQEIAQNPEIGREYPFSNKSYHMLKANRHILFYKFDENNCTIVRILHEKMDLKIHLTIK